MLRCGKYGALVSRGGGIQLKNQLHSVKISGKAGNLGAIRATTIAVCDEVSGEEGGGAYLWEDHARYVELLQKCGKAKDLAGGKRLHAGIISSGQGRDRFLANHLIQMYGKCGAIDEACSVFAKIRRPNSFSWTNMICAYAHSGHMTAAFNVFQHMQHQGIPLDNVTSTIIISACAAHSDLPHGRRMHAQILGTSLEFDPTVGNSIITMYGKCGRIPDARRAFDSMPARNVVSWNAMITVYTQHGHGTEALYLFEHMRLEGTLPNDVTFTTILDAFTCDSSLNDGRRIHACIVGCGFDSDIIVGTALLKMYANCGSLDDAQRVFDKMPERDVVSWNALISVYAQHAQLKEAIGLFQQMLHDGQIPDRITFVNILNACTSTSAIAEGKLIHARIMNDGFETDIMVGNSLVSMYGKCGCLEDAQRMFHKMPERNVITWNTMISVFSQHGNRELVLQLLRQMQVEGVTASKLTYVGVMSAFVSKDALADANEIHAFIAGTTFETDLMVMNAIVNMYGKCGSVEKARRVFDKMLVRDQISWNTIIAVYAQNGNGKEAFKLFQQMRSEGLMPDIATFICVVDACADEAALVEGRQMYAYITDAGCESNVVVGTALLNMYGKCGDLENAWEVFEKVPERDVISWNAMIAVYAQHGQGKEIHQVFQQMQFEGVAPNDVTFISVLSAGSHVGLMDECCYCFVSMFRNFRITPTVEHYNCMLDLFGRAGRLDEAESLISNMPFQPFATSWMTLLGACRMYSDIERGNQAAKHVLNMEPDSSGAYVLFSNIYAAAARSDDTVIVREMIGKDSDFPLQENRCISKSERNLEKQTDAACFG